MKKFLIITIPLLFLAGPVKAVCPVCTVAVCAGLGLSRWLGVDDLISGVWIGGLCISIILWTVDWLKKKSINFAYPTITVAIAIYAIVVIPMWIMGIIGHPQNVFLNADKLVFGIFSGSLIFVLSAWLHNYLKSENSNKSYFPYQKVALPLLGLIILSVIFYFLTCKL